MHPRMFLGHLLIAFNLLVEGSGKLLFLRLKQVLTLHLRLLDSPKLLDLKNPTLPLFVGPREVETTIFVMVFRTCARQVMFGAGTIFNRNILTLIDNKLEINVHLNNRLETSALCVINISGRVTLPVRRSRIHFLKWFNPKVNLGANLSPVMFSILLALKHPFTIHNSSQTPYPPLPYGPARPPTHESSLDRLLLSPGPLEAEDVIVSSLLVEEEDLFLLVAALELVGALVVPDIWTPIPTAAGAVAKALPIIGTASARAAPSLMFAISIGRNILLTLVRTDPLFAKAISVLLLMLTAQIPFLSGILTRRTINGIPPLHSETGTWMETLRGLMEIPNPPLSVLIIRIIAPTPMAPAKLPLVVIAIQISLIWSTAEVGLANAIALISSLGMFVKHPGLIKDLLKWILIGSLTVICLLTMIPICDGATVQLTLPDRPLVANRTARAFGFNLLRPLAMTWQLVVETARMSMSLGLPNAKIIALGNFETKHLLALTPIRTGIPETALCPSASTESPSASAD